MRVLVVEDDPRFASLLRRTLERAGYAADVAYAGAEALACVDEHDYAVLILDVNIPPPNGVELCRIFRETAEELATAVSAALAGSDGTSPELRAPRLRNVLIVDHDSRARELATVTLQEAASWPNAGHCGRRNRAFSRRRFRSRRDRSGSVWRSEG